jgi:hypothetical protein
MPRIRFFINVVFFLLALIQVKAQTDIDPDAEFIYKGNHYVPNSPWCTVGMGYGYNISEKTGEPNLMFDVHLKLKKPQYLGFGFMTSRERFFYNFDTIVYAHRWNKESVNSLHVMYGIRGEDIRRNYAVFIGPAVNWGYDYLPSDSLPNMHKTYIEPGLYLTLQYTHKIFYDIGVGATLFANVCKTSQVIGVTFNFYLSTAFKRKI